MADAASCSDVTVVYRTSAGEVAALSGVGATFPSSRLTAVVGPSGSGKSSLLRVLACIERPTSGRVWLGGDEVTGLGARRRRALRRRSVAYVFARPSDNVLPYLTVRDHLTLAARLRGSHGREAGELLSVLGLDHRVHHLPGQLSGGEQQRLAFATAVVGSPAVVVADEPTAELDHRSADALLSAVATLRDRGTTFIVSTHDPEVVARADVAVRLNHGAVA